MKNFNKIYKSYEIVKYYSKNRNKWSNFYKSEKKPIEQLNISDLGVDAVPKVELLKVEEPPQRKAGIKVASVAELVQKLKNEAKVI